MYVHVLYGSVCSHSSLQPLFEPYLATQLEHTRFESELDSPVPRCQPEEGTALLHSLASLSLQLPNNQPGNSLTHREMQLVWSLAAALWGPLPGEEEGEFPNTQPLCVCVCVCVGECVCECSPADPSLKDQRSYRHCLARRRALSHWLEEAAAPAIEKEMSSLGETVSAVY